LIGAAVLKILRDEKCDGRTDRGDFNSPHITYAVDNNKVYHVCKLRNISISLGLVYFLPEKNPVNNMNAI